ncbi:MAG: PD-(D/E)XK nuclease family protein, partial [Lachnospiraceae bacterium]|nr:PD-(D/E)XK nuclease family protein [Lachnospiraceae bacterium]
VLMLLDRMVELIGDEEVTLEEYLELLDAGFDEIRIGIIPKDQDYVQIGDIKRSRLRNIRALFFVGVNDGIIPAKANKGGLISDIEREFLSQNADGISVAPTIREEAYTQRLYLYMLMAKPSEKIFISYSKIASDGTSLKPSYFVKTICEMFPDIEIDYLGRDPQTPVFTEKTAFKALCNGIRNYYEDLEKNEEEDPENDENKYETLLKTYILNNGEKEKNDKIREILNLIDDAFNDYEYKRSDLLDESIAHALYGNEIKGSVTRLENYASCAYSHFIKYGLKLKEREEFSFEAKDMGIVFHEALMNFGKLLKERNIKWQELDDDLSAPLLEEAVERTMGSNDNSILYTNYRTGYLKERIKRITGKTISTLTYQLKKGEFRPGEFEYAFSAGNSLSSLNIKLDGNRAVRLSGQIDRYDICEDEENIYIKIMDYKSSKRDIDLLAVYKGLQLQLVVYLNAVTEIIENNNPDSEKNIIPAGILYYHIDDPLAEVKNLEDEEGAGDAILNKLKMSGLVNSDPDVIRLMDKELDKDNKKKSDVIPITLKNDGTPSATSKGISTDEFKVMCSYINLKIKKMGEEILSGNIAIKPNGVKDDKEACKYCEYKHICNYREDSDSMDDGEDDTENAENEAQGRSDKETSPSAEKDGTGSNIKKNLSRDDIISAMKEETDGKD